MNSLVNNEKQSHCIYHTHSHIKKVTNSHINTHKKQHSHSRCNCVQNHKKEQPELHQLTTKQQRKILSNRKNHTAVKRKNKNQPKGRTTSKQAMF